MIRNIMIENVDAYRERAVQNRNKGRHTGASAAGWDVVRPLDNCARARGKVAWHMAKSAALEVYARAVFPDRFWSGAGIAPTIDDAIEAGYQADRDALLATF